jgi:protein TonB
MSIFPQACSRAARPAIPALLALLLTACAAPPEPTQPRTVAMAEAKCPQPPYPAVARDAGVEGVTTLSIDVNPEGRVTRVAITEPSGTSEGHRALDALALETMQKCQFPPAPGFLAASSRVAYAWRLKD